MKLEQNFWRWFFKRSNGNLINYYEYGKKSYKGEWKDEKTINKGTFYSPDGSQIYSW